MDNNNAIYISDSVAIGAEFLTVKAARSSGPGGQNVNKTATKAELHFDFEHCPALENDVRERLRELARNRMDASGQILITSQKTRSLYANVADAREKLKAMIIKALQPPKHRVATKPSASVRRRRVEQKRKHGESKQRRQEWKRTRNDE